MAAAHQDSPQVNIESAQGLNMQEYKSTVPLWKRVWQHSLTQMMLLSVQAFCGPAMSDAITGEYIIRYSFGMFAKGLFLIARR